MYKPLTNDIVDERGSYETVPLFEDEIFHKRSVMRTVYENGELLVDDTFEAIRGRARRLS